MTTASPSPAPSTPSPSALSASTPDPEDLSPRARLLEYGEGSLSDDDLLTVLLGDLVRSEDGVLVTRLVDLLGGLSKLPSATRARLADVGMADESAASLLALAALTRRIAVATPSEGTALICPAALADFLFLQYQDFSRMQVGAIFLDPELGYLSHDLLFSGNRKACSIETPPILREALLRSASAIVLFRLQKSPWPDVTPEDADFRDELREAAAKVGVDLVDFLVLARGGRWRSVNRFAAVSP